MRKLLAWFKAWGLFWLMLMSGAASIIREFYSLQEGKHVVTLFWTSIWVCFVVSAIAAWVLKEHELLAERNKNAKPLIVGEILEVIEETALTRGHMFGFDHYFTLRFCLRNERAATNFQSFDLYLFTKDTKDKYKGEAVSLSGYLLERQEPQKRSARTEMMPVTLHLDNYDGASLLDQWQTREGWLRFVVRDVEWDTEKGAPIFTHLDLIITDGSGSVCTLISNPPWKKISDSLKIWDGNDFMCA